MSKRIQILLFSSISAALALIVVGLVLLPRPSEKVDVNAQTPVNSVSTSVKTGGQAEPVIVAPSSNIKEIGSQPLPVNPPVGPVGSGVTVQGSGLALVKPDIVRFTAGIEVRAPTVGEAQSQAAAKLKSITDAITGQGIKQEDIKTTSYDIQPNYVYNNNQPPRLDGYIIRVQLNLTIRDTTKAGAIIDAVGAAGANLISGITFTVENNTEATKQARAAAVLDAKAKAEQLAASGGFNLGSIISLTEISSTQPLAVAAGAPNPSGAAIASGARPPETIIESGQFRVLVNVQVVFNIK